LYVGQIGRIIENIGMESPFVVRRQRCYIKPVIISRVIEIIIHEENVDKKGSYKLKQIWKTATSNFKVDS